MSPVVVALVLASAFVHAGWNALLKRQRDPETALVAAMVACAFFSIGGAVVMRAPLPPGRAIAWSIASGLFEAGYLATLGKAMSLAPLSVVYTVMRGGALLLVWPLSVALLGEHASPVALGGVTLVIAGLGLAAATPQTAGAPRASAPGLGWALLSACFIAGYSRCYKQALATGGTPLACVAISLTLSLSGVSLRLARRLREVGALLRQQPWTVLLMGFCSNASFVLFLCALERGGTGETSTLRNASVVFAQGFACMIGERPRRHHVLGALLVAAGAVALAWPRS